MIKCSVNMILHIYNVTAVIFLLKSITVCPWVAIESCKTITVNHCRRTNLEEIFGPEHIEQIERTARKLFNDNESINSFTTNKIT